MGKCSQKQDFLSVQGHNKRSKLPLDCKSTSKTGDRKQLAQSSRLNLGWSQVRNASELGISREHDEQVPSKVEASCSPDSLQSAKKLGQQLPQIGIISISIPPSDLGTPGSLSARTPRTTKSHQQLVHATRRRLKTSQDALHLMVENSMSSEDLHHSSQPLPSRSHLFTPRAREMAKQRVARINLMVQCRVPASTELKPPSSIRNRRKEGTQSTSRTSSRPSTQIRTVDQQSVSGEYGLEGATTEFGEELSWTSGIEAPSTAVHETVNTFDGSILLPTPPRSTRSTADWMEWSDPLSEARKARRFRSRTIRDATPSTVRSIALDNYAEPKLSDNSETSASANIAVDHELKQAVQLLDRREFPVNSSSEHRRRRALGRTPNVEQRTLSIGRNPPSGLNASTANQVPWHIQTMAEKAYHIEKQKLAGVGSGLDIANLVTQQADMFEGQMAALLQDSLGNIQWGQRGASRSRGGLEHLEATMKQSLEKIPQHLERLERHEKLMEDLQTEQSKQMMLEGQAHAEATSVMAELYMNNFHGYEVAKDVDQIDVQTMDEEGLDTVLASLFLEAARTTLDDSEPKPAGFERVPSVESATTNTIPAHDPHEESEAIHPADVIQHVDFHRDIAYIKYKTTVFKQTMRDRKLNPNILDLAKQNVNPIMGGLHLQDKAMHFLRICFIEADHLPVMDIHKKSKGDVYVRCSLFAGDAVVSGHKGEEIINTRVAWNTNKPNWKDQEFEFIVPQTHEDVVLRVEVRDVDMSGYGQGSLDDHFIGELEFLILQEGTQVMVTELEYEEWYLLRNKDKSDVRHNLGVENSVLKGRGSVLRVRHIFTKKPRLSRFEYAKRIQGNLRCLFARRRAAEAKKELQAMLARANNTEEMEGKLITARIWKDYTAECVRQMTHPIRKIKEQLTSSEITLTSYVVSYNGIVALSKALRDASALGRLRNLVLRNMEIRGQGVLELVRAMNSSNNMLQLLKLDGNPICMEPLAGQPHNPNTNRLGRGTTAARAVAQLLNDTPTLTCLSLSRTQLGDDGLAIIANAVSQHPYITSLDVSDNNNKDNPGEMLESAVAVGKMLAETKSLIELDYSWNNLSLSSGQAFLGFQGGQPLDGQGLFRNKTLRRLVVHKTALLKQTQCCQGLARVLGQDDCPLDFLDVSFCDLTVQQNIEHVACGVVENPALRILVMDGNQIGWDGYKAVMTRKGRKRYVSSFQRKAEAAAKHPAAKGLEEVLEIYRSYDEDGSGTMDTDEFAEILGRLGFMKTGWTEKDAAAVFDKIDVDGSGEIDFSEFYEWYCDELMVGEDGESAMQVSMKGCNVNVKDANFDGSDPDGTYDIDMSLMRSRTILLALMKLVYNGKGEFVPGTVFQTMPRADAPNEYDTLPFTIQTPPDISSWVIPRAGYLNFDFKTTLTQAYNSVSINLDELLELRRMLEDPTSSRAQRIALLDEHLTPGRFISYHQALDLLKVYLLDTAGAWQTDKDKKLAPIVAAKSQPGSNSASPEPSSMTSRSTLDDLDVAMRRKSLIRQGSGRAKGIDREERLAFIQRVFPILNEAERDLRLLSHLEHDERTMLYERLGIAMHNFDQRNPTGYQRLRLNKVGERGLVLQLIEMCNEFTHEQESFLAANSHKIGGSKDPLSLIWRNARFNGRLFFFEKHWRVPYTGVLELDFVDVRKPDPAAVIRISDEDYFALVAELRNPFLSEKEKVAEVRKVTLDLHLSCLQVVGLLCELPIAQESWRVELLVILFSRIVDWRGYRTLLFYLPVTARGALMQRVGKPMLFYDGASSAVGHWKLNLANSEDRFIMQELLYRAHGEPGSNILDCEYNGSAYEVPSSWLTLVPREGWISFFYSRDRSVLKACRTQGGWHLQQFRRASSTGSGPEEPGPLVSDRKELDAATYPPKFYVPTLPEGYEGGREGLNGTWVYMEKIRLVKENLQRRLATLSQVFAALDEDAGGSLSREEISLGLTRNGVWLAPPDMEMLLDMLDIDRSGEIDLAEFRDFWENAPPLRQGDYAQESYWASRGIRGRRYEELVPFYDIRGQYPTETVLRYGLENEAHAPRTHHA